MDRQKWQISQNLLSSNYPSSNMTNFAKFVGYPKSSCNKFCEICYLPMTVLDKFCEICHFVWQILRNFSVLNTIMFENNNKIDQKWIKFEMLITFDPPVRLRSSRAQMFVMSISINFWAYLLFDSFLRLCRFSYAQ